MFFCSIFGYFNKGVINVFFCRQTQGQLALYKNQKNSRCPKEVRRHMARLLIFLSTEGLRQVIGMAICSILRLHTEQRNMKNLFKTLSLFAVGMMLSVSCSGKEAVERENSESMEKERVLIVYFSHAGENYSVGNVKVGNTKLVADEIQKVTGGDVFEIVAEKVTICLTTH